MIKKEYPEEGEFVVGTVNKVQSYGAFVTLDEYQSREGFIHIAEIASGWVKRIRNHIKEKQKVVCKVMHVDPGKGGVGHPNPHPSTPAAAMTPSPFGVYPCFLRANWTAASVPRISGALTAPILPIRKIFPFR